MNSLAPQRRSDELIICIKKGTFAPINRTKHIIPPTLEYFSSVFVPLSEAQNPFLPSIELWMSFFVVMIKDNVVVKERIVKRRLFNNFSFFYEIKIQYLAVQLYIVYKIKYQNVYFKKILYIKSLLKNKYNLSKQNELLISLYALRLDLTKSRFRKNRQ